MTRRSTAGTRIGIDLGGTKIEALLVDSLGHEIRRMRIATPKGDYRQTLEALVQLVTSLERGHEIEGRASVGIGIPGSISKHTGRVHNANSTWLNGQALDQDLRRRLDRPVRVANDANCFALSEASDGAGEGSPVVLGIILGTGAGSGIVVRGQLLEGPHGIAGEWGHNPLPWARDEEFPGYRCWCGRQGCLETWVSGPGMAADHYRMSGSLLSAEAIGHAATIGEPDARATLDRHADRLARGLAHVVNLVDPDVIVIGGGLCKLNHLYSELAERMRPHLFADQASLDIRPPKWGDASGVRGAAWLAGSA